MKIAILTQSLDDNSGTNLQAFSHAAAFAEAGHSVTLFTFSSEGELLGMPVMALKRPFRLPIWDKPWRNFLYLFPFRRLLMRQNLNQLRGFDAVIVYSYLMSWLGDYAKKAYDIRYVQFIDGVFLERLYPSLYIKVYLRLVNRWFWKASLANADFIVTETKFLTKLLQEQIGLDSMPVGSLVDSSHFNPRVSGKRVRDLYHLGDDPLILFVDRLDPAHGVEILLKSFNIVRKIMPDARLMLIGTCHYKSYWKRIQRLANESTFFVEYVPHTEIPDFYAASTVFATCCLWEEAYSHTIVEAEACGKPVVAFNLGAHEEVVKSGETGILVDQVGDAQEFASTLITLLSNRDLASDMGQKAAEWVRYLADKGASDVQKLLHRIEALTNTDSSKSLPPAK